MAIFEKCWLTNFHVHGQILIDLMKVKKKKNVSIYKLIPLKSYKQ